MVRDGLEHVRGLLWPWDQNLSGKVGILGKFMDRRRHLHMRPPGGNLKNGKDDMNGKNDKIGTDGGNGKNEYSFPEASSHFAKFLVAYRL